MKNDQSGALALVGSGEYLPKLQALEKLEKEKETPEQTDKDYISVVKKVKKENITPDNIAEIMLCQIPGISSVTAVAIMDRFKTIPNLIQEIQQNDNCLKDIIYQNTKGQTRKINKTS